MKLSDAIDLMKLPPERVLTDGKKLFTAEELMQISIDDPTAEYDLRQMNGRIVIFREVEGIWRPAYWQPSR